MNFRVLAMSFSSSLYWFIFLWYMIHRCFDFEFNYKTRQRSTATFDRMRIRVLSELSGWITVQFDLSMWPRAWRARLISSSPGMLSTIYIKTVLHRYRLCNSDQELVSIVLFQHLYYFAHVTLDGHNLHFKVKFVFIQIMSTNVQLFYLLLRLLKLP